MYWCKLTSFTSDAKTRHRWDGGSVFILSRWMLQFSAAEKLIHHMRCRIASVVEARQTESGLQGSQQ